MGLDSTAYKIVLLLHILCAIVGFGSVLLNGVYGAQAKKRPGPGGLAIMEANILVSGIGEYFIYAVFVLGFALVGMSDKAWTFGQTWVWLAIVLYLVGIAISHAIVIPSAKKMRDLAAELAAAGPPPAGAAGPPPQVAQMAALGNKLRTWSPALHLILVVILVLMIWKPGA